MLSLLPDERLARVNEKGGDIVSEVIIDIIVTIAANVITYYICKWLDGRNGGR